MTPSAGLGVYLLGLAWTVRGFMTLCFPQHEYRTIGIKDMRSSDDIASFSPIFMLGFRDISIGMFLIAHQREDNPTAVATLLAVMGIMKLGDASLVFIIGDGNRTVKGLGHLFMALMLLFWIVVVLH
ncbi:hypothetical protein BKA59DRAFT_475990 [Fusarium tricinctum]|uniref:Uncharacterized protein n=1 Tax=Fusarium tricinctum TaxID=61284 RepID=A0A8K0RX19_9HYPO|nr:hypothetical protein BKA59DRAFT_475990 [Fusarium tricinctum]